MNALQNTEEIIQLNTVGFSSQITPIQKYLNFLPFSLSCFTFEEFLEFFFIYSLNIILSITACSWMFMLSALAACLVSRFSCLGSRLLLQPRFWSISMKWLSSNTWFACKGRLGEDSIKKSSQVTEIPTKLLGQPYNIFVEIPLQKRIGYSLCDSGAKAGNILGIRNSF